MGGEPPRIVGIALSRTGTFIAVFLTLYLTERGVKVVGTDAWSWDAPFSHTARRWAETVGDRWGLSVLAPEGARSATVTAYRLPAELEGPPIVSRLKQRGKI